MDGRKAPLTVVQSNRMGTKPSNSVVDPRGRVWGTQSLYIADASVLPTASGVNPMISCVTLRRRSSLRSR